jgi:hypothetical protein
MFPGKWFSLHPSVAAVVKGDRIFPGKWFSLHPSVAAVVKGNRPYLFTTEEERNPNKYAIPPWRSGLLVHPFSCCCLRREDRL